MHKKGCSMRSFDSDPPNSLFYNNALIIPQWLRFDEFRRFDGNGQAAAGL